MRRRARVAIVVAMVPLVALLAGCDTQLNTLTRPIDPVVLTGADLPALVGAAPGDIVGFRWVKDTGWQQLPVQVDEKKTVDTGALYHGSLSGVLITAYADASTWTGADLADPTFDTGDELVFMARDAGGLPPDFSEPAGVVAGSGVDVRITDPTVEKTVAHVYLFRRSGPLDPAAGASYVTYAFSLSSGNYKTTYKYQTGPNPESSRITTAAYQRHFGDRWLEDEVKVTTPGASGVDLLDRHKVRFGPGVCTRTEDTFDSAEGAFITNKSGPVRAIRSYIGANSGPNTVRTHLFYDQREDVITDLRVHQIPGIMDFYDYAPAAAGMTYANSNNTAGVAIDGAPDSVTAGNVVWEKVDGAQGAIVMSNALITNLSPGLSSWYEDNSTNPTTQCTGDADAYGASGPHLSSSIACTDPANSCTNTLQAMRSLSYLPPGVSATDAALRAQQMATPLATTAAAWTAT